MEVRTNYHECLTNLACSIRKYFELPYHHNTLSDIDDLLTKKQPKNVIVMLFDGMGTKILKQYLDDDAFLMKHLNRSITSVFPTTTTAATKSVLTGLNPVEHGYFGWYSYIKEIDKVMMLFRGIEKDSQEVNESYDAIRDKYMIDKTIIDEINEMGKYYSRKLFPFDEGAYQNLDEMLDILAKECLSDGKKYLYAYDIEPDHSMHHLGTKHDDIKTLIKERDEKIAKWSEQLEDSMVFIIADHGHIDIENIYLDDYPDLMNLFERTTSIEPRACSFKIKDNKHQEFTNLFHKYFGDDFKLYSKQEIIEIQLFGDGKPNYLFDAAIGDYLAIAYESNKALLTKGDKELASRHGGYSDDELYIPLIIIDKTKR